MLLEAVLEVIDQAFQEAGAYSLVMEHLLGMEGLGQSRYCSANTGSSHLSTLLYLWSPKRQQETFMTVYYK